MKQKKKEADKKEEVIKKDLKKNANIKDKLKKLQEKEAKKLDAKISKAKARIGKFSHSVCTEASPPFGCDFNPCKLCSEKQSCSVSQNIQWRTLTIIRGNVLVQNVPHLLEISSLKRP